ncbi:MAG TPA: DUF2911 domain-containing protein [Pyrinomonadaceae bacterium]|jgi:hypothetical protein|nr:DUF2911 domain-containing protein [Pyrinomonadaceae bacterium]
MSTFKRFYTSSFFMWLLVLGTAGYTMAQTPVRLPRPSQKASVMQTIGVTDVTITYSRPGVKGRTIWGDPLPEQASVKGEATLDDQNVRPKGAPIVPWGHAWRTGANEATQFVVTDDVLINGQKLPAGSYSLHTIPTKNEWTIIFNSVANQWGSFNYDATKDTLRVKAKPEWVSDNKEWLEYWIDPINANSAQVNIRWEKVRVPFTVEVPNVEAVWRAKVDAAMAAAPNDEKIPLSVAGAYAGDDKWDEAIAWADKSIKIKETFQNLATKARLLYSAGRKEEAFTVGDQAVARGKADKVDTTNFEKRLANMKAGKL